MAVRRAALAQQHDHELVDLLMRFSRSKFGTGWVDGVVSALTQRGDPSLDRSELQLAIPWGFHAYRSGPRGESVSALYRREKGRHLSPDLRDMLDAQIASWCSLWVVESVDRGRGAFIRDLLSDERRYVFEHLGTENLVPDLVLLGRVVDVSGISFLAGVHPQPLPSDQTFELVRAARRHFRVRTRPVKLEHLRVPEFQEWLIGEWRFLSSALRRPMTLANTDGDSMAPTIDHFTFDPARRSDLIARLVTIPGAGEAEDGETAGETMIVVTRPGKGLNAATGDTVTGVLRVSDGKLRVETNSTRRADALRKALAKVAESLVQHRLREETSIEQLLSAMRSRAERGEPRLPRPEQSPEALEVVREFKRRHYAAWVDERIPALGGLTPRAAARSPTMREQLENLLRRFEQSEASLPESERGDVGMIRRELGM